MRLCEEHRLGGIPALGQLDGICVGCAVETKLQSAANECQEHITAVRGRIAELEEYVRHLEAWQKIDYSDHYARAHEFLHATHGQVPWDETDVRILAEELARASRVGAESKS
jgi:hypothetical protein